MVEKKINKEKRTSAAVERTRRGAGLMLAVGLKRAQGMKKKYCLQVFNENSATLAKPIGIYTVFVHPVRY